MTLWALASLASAAETDPAAQRILQDVNAGKPLVAHVVVALADNEYQGIVRVPQSLGDGDRPHSNLYWGAMYGVKGFLRRSAEWQVIQLPPSVDPRILDRVLFRRELTREGKPATVYLLAEAWQGRQIAASIGQFLEMTRGQHAESIRVDGRQIAVGPLVTTASLMAPEAYVLDAVVASWFAGASPTEVVGAAANAYGQYQKISGPSARRIFHRNP